MDINPGEQKQIAIQLPAGFTREEVLAAFDLEGRCGCGGKLVRKSLSVWACDRERWWHRFIFRGHARIKVDL